MVRPHQLERVGHPILRAERHGLDDHARLGALDLVDLRDLLLDRQVAVDDPDAALARERDRHARLGHRVHRGGADRDRELDLAGEARAGRDLVRKHRRLGRNEQDVVERQTFLGESLAQREEPLDLLATELDAHARPWPATAPARQSRAPPPPDDARPGTCPHSTTPRKHEAQAPRGDLGSTGPALASALNVQGWYQRRQTRSEAPRRAIRRRPAPGASPRRARRGGWLRVRRSGRRLPRAPTPLRSPRRPAPRPRRPCRRPVRR